MIPVHLQVCTPEQAQKFKDLGILQYASFWHQYSDFFKTYKVVPFHLVKPFVKANADHKHLAAYTMAELWQMLPNTETIEKESGREHHLITVGMASQILQCINDNDEGYTVPEINQRIQAVRTRLIKK